MGAGLSPVKYRELVEQVRRCVRAHVPDGAVVLIASKGDDDLVRVEGCRAWHFPRDEWGAYAGHHPGSSAEAIAHLRQLYDQGARYLVFPSTAAWWLEHYRELAEHLDAAHVVTAARDGVCVIYELRESPAFDAFAGRDGIDDERRSADGAAGGPTPLLSLVRPVAPSTLRVLTILARFGTSQYSSAEDGIADLFSRQMRGVDRHTIVVDNALRRDLVEEREGSVLLGGDNSAREFSAFDRAVDFVGSDIWSYDFVHCATSAFNTLYVAYLDRFEPSVLQAMAGRPACVGHIDCYNEPIEVRGYHAQHWVRSCFFCLPPAEIKALGSFVSVAPDMPLFTGDPDNPFRADAPLSGRYRDYITQWLTGGGLGQGVEWHSTFALTRETVGAFEDKARAILNEQLLSIRLQALGCHLVDVTWLSTMLRRHTAAEIPLPTSWREQLAHRDRDALVLNPSQMEPARVGV